MSEARRTGIHGAAITLLGQTLKILVQFTSLVILSRLLSPTDFGLVAMVTVFLALGDLIRDFGMSTIGLQRPSLTQQEASNLFWLNAILGLSTALLLLCSTPLIVALYRDERLWLVVPALSPLLLFGGLATQFKVQVSRSMKFLRLNVADVSVQVIVLFTAILAAVFGLEYWSIVISNLVGSILLLLSYKAISAWRPSPPKREITSSGVMKDGAAFGLAQFLTYLSSNADTLVIGARWQASAVGFYDRAFQLYSIPGAKLISPLTQVVLPVINRASREGRDTDSVMLRIQFGLGFFAILAFSVSGSIANWLIPTILGPDWQISTSFFQVLAVGGMAGVFSNINYWRTIIGNHGWQLILLNLVTKPITILLIILASFISLEAVSAAVSIGLTITWPLALLWFRKVADWPSMTFFKEGLRLLIPGYCSYAAGFLLGQTIEDPSFLSSLLIGLSVLTIFIGGTLVIPGGMTRFRQLGRDLSLLFPRKKK
ncbi:lipopolysaccharide biosynthesis protein [Leucobacter sp. Z1108]|uniref:lipopolysaccharide biosynthesis protein n=1 Tax=Leucobacter sp. Z1108 TaxID=3439066 RepID=UPI003F3CA039